MPSNTTIKPDSKRSSSRRLPILSAAVGLGNITLDSVQLLGDRPLKVGGTADCQLPFTCDATDVAERVDGVWRVQVPQGMLVDGEEQAESLELFDWNSGVRLRDGDAWLQLQPTRSERFTDDRSLVDVAIQTAKTVPMLWLSLALTFALGAVVFWASGALSGTGVAATLGQAGYGFGGASDRIASFGEGDLASAGTPSAHWVSIPTPTEDAVSDEEPIDEPVDEPEEEIVERSAEETVEEIVETQDGVAEEDVEETPETAEIVEQETTEETAVPRDPKARKGGKSSGRSGGATAGGGGSGGLGGGTDDGFADRSDSVKALERRLLACVQDNDAHRVKLSVDTDGQAMMSSVDYSRAGLGATERACVVAALDDWAFPAGDEEYEISLRMKKSSRSRA